MCQNILLIVKTEAMSNLYLLNAEQMMSEDRLSFNELVESLMAVQFTLTLICSILFRKAEMKRKVFFLRYYLKAEMA